MEFFRNIKKSIYGPKFYQELLQKPASFSFKYFFLFALLAAVIATIILSFSNLPSIKSAWDDFDKKVFQGYPANLVVKIENGKVSTNAQEPFYVKLSENSESEIENLLAIDTKNAFDVNKFEDYKSYCLLTETNLICRDEGQLRIQSLEKTPNITINKDLVDSLAQKAQIFYKLVYPIYFLMVIFVFFLAVTFRLVYLLFFALLIWLVAKIKKIDIGYGKSYQLGLHLMTPAFIITYLFFLITPKIDIPWFFTIIALLAAIINLKKTEQPVKI